MLDQFFKSKALSGAKLVAQKLLSEQGEANAHSLAHKLMQHFQTLDRKLQLEFFAFLAAHFNPDPLQVLQAAKDYAVSPGQQQYIRLFQVVEPARQELLRRVNRAPGGTAAILQMRTLLLQALKSHPEFAAVDADMHHLLSSWFNPGFLELHEITWSSPAILLEKLIAHESVHAIDGWDDLRRRLHPDRRCFAFFHPQLPNEPLIFVEVALVPSIATNIQGLLDKQAPVLEKKLFKAAMFYSISNCQPGLRGVSLGNFLIKRVAERIAQELPSVKTFCTLSPIPGLNRWLDAGAPLGDAQLNAATRKRHAAACAALGLDRQRWSQQRANGWHPEKSSEPIQVMLQSLCAIYLVTQSTGEHGDAVARFHLTNGASLHNIHWAADISKKGLAQSAGMMVNYLYELDRIEENHAAFINQTVIHARAIRRWL